MAFEKFKRIVQGGGFMSTGVSSIGRLNVNSTTIFNRLGGTNAWTGTSTITSGTSTIPVSASVVTSGASVILTGNTSVTSDTLLVMTVNSIVDGISFSASTHDTTARDYGFSYVIVE